MDEDVCQTDASFEDIVLSEQELHRSNNDTNTNRERNGIMTEGQRTPDIRADLDELEEFDSDDTNTSDSYYKNLKPR